MVSTLITYQDGTSFQFTPGAYDPAHKLRALDLGAQGMAIFCEENDIFDGGKVCRFVSAVHTDSISSSILPTDKKRVTTASAEGPVISGSDQVHYLLGGEIMPVLTGYGLEEPTPEVRASMLTILNKTLRIDILPQMPRLSHCLDLYDNESHALTSPPPVSAQVDFMALHRFRSFYLGGQNPSGYYEMVCPEGGDGYSNLHYNIGLWMLLAYLRNPTPDSWGSYVAFMLAQAAYGIHYAAGSHRGFFRTEKGYGFVGRQKAGTWEKQFPQQMFAAMLMTSHPLFEIALQAHLVALQNTPANFWGGSWGERIVQLFMQSLYSAYLYFGQPTWMRDKVLACMADVLRFIDPTTGYIKSREGYTSPWMQFELIMAFAAWFKLGIGKQHEQKVRMWFVNLMAGAVRLVNGYPQVAYHAYPIDYSGSHPLTHTASLVGALLAFPDMTYMGKTGLEWLPALDAHVAPATPNLADLGLRNGAEGPGWVKVPPIALSCLLFAPK